MQWTDEGFVLGARKHGETSVIAEVLTPEHGRRAGIVRSGRSRRMRPVLQQGNKVQVTWRARLEDHLGAFVIEPLAMNVAGLMDDPFRLAGLAALCAHCLILPERENHRPLYDAMAMVLDNLDADDVWPALLVRWELGLLRELGFGLDLSACAATGTTGELAYVSPRTGRAVSKTAGLPYHDKLLALPGFVAGTPATGTSQRDILAGFELTGYFLERHIHQPRGSELPEARTRLIGHIARSLERANEP